MKTIHLSTFKDLEAGIVDLLRSTPFAQNPPVYCLTGRDRVGKSTLLQKIKTHHISIIGHSKDTLPVTHHWIANMISSTQQSNFISQTTEKQKYDFFSKIALAKLTLARSIAKQTNRPVVIDGYMYKWLARECTRGTMSLCFVEKNLPTLSKPDTVLLMDFHHCFPPTPGSKELRRLEYLHHPSDFHHFQRDTYTNILRLLRSSR